MRGAVICKRMWGSAIETVGVLRQSQPRKPTPSNIDHQGVYISFSDSALSIVFFGDDKLGRATLEKGELDGAVVAMSIGIVDEGGRDFINDGPTFYDERYRDLLDINKRLGNEPYWYRLRQWAISTRRFLPRGASCRN